MKKSRRRRDFFKVNWEEEGVSEAPQALLEKKKNYTIEEKYDFLIGNLLF